MKIFLDNDKLNVLVLTRKQLLHPRWCTKGCENFNTENFEQWFENE
jgi:hypothetical protein